MAGTIFYVESGGLSKALKSWGVRTRNGRCYPVNYGHELKNGRGMNWAEAIMATTPTFQFKPFIDEDMEANCQNHE